MKEKRIFIQGIIGIIGIIGLAVISIFAYPDIFLKVSKIWDIVWLWGFFGY